MQQRHIDYLNELRESGKTNMFGATPYLMKRFNLKRNDARIILVEWMNTFEDTTNSINISLK